MTWQDIALAVSIFALNVALVPSLWGNKKPRLLTSGFTTLALLPQVVVFISLSLWYSLVMVTINLLLWVALFVQGYMYQRKIDH